MRNPQSRSRTLRKCLDRQREITEVMESLNMFNANLILPQIVVDSSDILGTYKCLRLSEEVHIKVIYKITFNEALMACYNNPVNVFYAALSRSAVRVNKDCLFRILSAMVKLVTIGIVHCAHLVQEVFYLRYNLCVISVLVH